MKLKSSIKLTSPYVVDEIFGNKCLITFIDLSTEEIQKVKYEDNETTEYVYDAYEMTIIYNEKYIQDNYDKLMSQAKQAEYDKLAKAVREERNKLIAETDIYALSDRTMTEEMVKYRQELRDITSQDGFPYNVIFPTKPAK